MKRSFLFLFLGLLLSFSFDSSYKFESERKLVLSDVNSSFNHCYYFEEDLDLELLMTFNPQVVPFNILFSIVKTVKINTKANTKISIVYRIFISFPAPPSFLS